MEDELGIVYIIENAQQFWSEIDDVLTLPQDVTLQKLDSALNRFVVACSSYHEQYLQSPLQLEHCCNLLLSSELFEFHSERMCEILVDDARTTTDPHTQFVIYSILLFRGRQKSEFFRSAKRWQPLIPLLMDHILVDIDPEVEDIYLGASLGGSRSGMLPHQEPVPIEAKMRSLAIRFVYEACRVQKMTMQELKVYNDSFLDSLFDLVEQTRNMQDENFNYSVIKLIVALNEQFMVAALGPAPIPVIAIGKQPEAQNHVLTVLMRRLGHSKTFGENMIFMLNRANHTPEDLCMQLLVLKILYLLFTTKGTSDYFYTNDLCVLVDVILREVIDLDEDSESLRHTYLRVLHPLLTKTQLRDTPYKRVQIVRALESLVENAEIRDLNATTKRLVERCLGGDWCVQYRSHIEPRLENGLHTVEGSTREGSPTDAAVTLSASKPKALKSSRSVGNLKGAAVAVPPRLEVVRRPSNESAISLPGVASASTFNLAHVPKKRRPHPPPKPPGNASSVVPHFAVRPLRADSLGATSDGGGQSAHYSLPASASLPSSPVPPLRRSAPAPPQKRRKAPPIPVGRSNGGATITAIASSTG